MGGGPSQSTINKQNELTDQQMSLSKEEFEYSKEDNAQRKALMQPAIDFNKAIASGDSKSLMTAAAPYITNLTKSSKKAKEDIMESTGPGAVRDISLAQNDVNTRSATAETKNSLFTSALDKLANIGSGIGSFSLNEAGASISGANSAAQINKSAGEMEGAGKANTLNFLGQMAGGVGSAVSGTKLW